MLHIVNGDSFGDKLRQSDIEGEVLVWREALYEGPIYTDLRTEKALMERARYLAEAGVPQELYLKFSLEQEERLDQLESSGEEMVLWFEYDLFDMTMFMYLLHRIAKLESHGTVNLLYLDAFPGIEDFRGLGQLTVDQTKGLAGKWVRLTDEQIEFGCQAWEAYSSADPRVITLLIQGDMSLLPCLKPALEYHLKRFPNESNGLSPLEQSVLTLVSQGDDRFGSLFNRISSEHKMYGLGDIQFNKYLKDLIEAVPPLLTDEEGRLQLTRQGELVREGKERVGRSDCYQRWLGGVRLSR